jgi:hypothetical protein
LGLVRFRTKVEKFSGADLFFTGIAVEMPVHVMPPLERAARYREYAADSLKRAAAAQSQGVKAGHLDMAARWDSLAQDIERRLDFSD